MSDRWNIYEFIEDATVPVTECRGALVRFDAGQHLLTQMDLEEDVDLRCIAAGSRAACEAAARLLNP